MAPVRLIFVGGFLGAGKTTLLAAAARRLAERGHRVGVITNDQAAQLVDTHNLRAQGLNVAEVAGGCFCCRFQDLLAAAGRLSGDFEPDILLGEPVGSCTDISATVLQPLKRLYADRLRLAPYTVLADAVRLRDLLNDRARGLFPDSILYIYSKQLEEADLLLVNKADLLAPAELAELRAAAARGFPAVEVRCVSARRGDGVDEWLEWVLQDRPAGARIAAVDYDVYAAGEAALGWLNARVDLASRKGVDWAALGRGLLEDLRAAFGKRSAEIGHLKVFLTAPDGALVASVTRGAEEPLLLTHGKIRAKARNAELILNARVHLAPEELRAEVERALGRLAEAQVEARVLSLEAFRPGRPRPTHRLTEVVP